nr:MAG TPA: hypothetical protein [Bacteriophage sp.]
MTLTALCERFIDKNSKISVIELKDDFTLETLFDNEPIWHLEFSKWDLYSVKYIDVASYTLRVYVTTPNDGYKKCDY